MHGSISLDVIQISPISTKTTPTLIAYYTAAIGGMGLISKMVGNYAHPGVCLEITPLKLYMYIDERGIPKQSAIELIIIQ